MRLLLSCLALAIPGVCIAAEPPPAALEPYIGEDGAFDPGDYGWIKGRFPDATPEEGAAFRSIMEWASQCREEAQSALHEELTAEGYPEADLQNILVGPLLCRQVAMQPLTPPDLAFVDFEREAASSLPLAQGYLAATRIAQETARPASEELGDMLVHRTLGEQMGRKAFTWGLGLEPDSPDLSPGGKAIFQSRVSFATQTYDHANTEWLKGVVAKHGWPTLSEVGERGSGAAWLLVQHADADPLFQLQALRMMEPLVDQGEVLKRNYAYLYDRIMLKLAGKQRYATQVRCSDGVRSPLPLEDEERVDELRGEMGMETAAEYIAMMNRDIPCESLPENTLPR